MYFSCISGFPFIYATGLISFHSSCSYYCFCLYQWVFVADLMYSCKKLPWHNAWWDSSVILIIKPTRCTISQIYFDKVLHMFRRDLLSIIRSHNTVYTATGICHASYVDCPLARSGWFPS
jgi:hypothetical protein